MAKTFKKLYKRIRLHNGRHSLSSRHSLKPASTIRACGHSRKHNKQIIVSTFLEMLNTIKVYHWNTYSYAEHKATDELYAKLNEHIDSFVEVLLGKQGDRLNRLDHQVPMLRYRHTLDFKQKIFQYRDYLTKMNECFDSTADTDLLNIRDEILGDINQFLYLMTFNK